MNSSDAYSFPRRLAVLGSTGSIGRQTLEIARAFPDRFITDTLTARSNWQLLAEQAREFKPGLVVIADESHYEALKEALKDTDTEVAAGSDALIAAATRPTTDIVVGALVGYSGLIPTVSALEAGKTVALANKETLVVGGEIIDEIVARKGKRILPVDSEHSAIFQCLQGERHCDVSKIILTASGGPFRTFPKESLDDVTVEQALSHPNWDMGAKVTIDSATMMNKGFEMIEARWLFDMSPNDIEVVVHPESIIHSMVEFTDGSVKAQLGLPDMRLPIEVALAHPDRLDLRNRLGSPRLDIARRGPLTFEEPDLEKFPLLRLAYEVAAKGGLYPAIMNAANEMAVKAFLNREISFTDIGRIVSETVEDFSSHSGADTVTINNIAEAHAEGTEIASAKIELIRN